MSDLAGAAALAAILLAGCADAATPPPHPIDLAPSIDPASHREEVERWAAVRDEWLPSAAGPLAQVALCRVAESDLPVAIGSASTADCRIPGTRAAAEVGRLEARGDTLVLEADGGLFWVGEKSAREAHLLAVRDRPQVDGAAAWHRSVRLTGRWAAGAVTIWVTDTLAEARDGFTGIERWPVDTAWRFDAQFTPAIDDWRQVATVRGFDLPRQVAGTVTIEVNGRRVPLTALTKGRGGTSWLVVIRDATSGTGSYPAGRFVDVEFADSTGHTVVDFNRARNPDCAFTDASPCPLPPAENRFAEAITAGEKTYKR
jgi:uncharacterized protein (DUF1684 family)